MHALNYPLNINPSLGEIEDNAQKELKKSLLQRIPAKIHQPLNILGWQIEAKKKQQIILDILKITKDPTHPQLYELYKNVAKMAFFAFLPDLLDWALDSYRNGVALYKFPNFIETFQEFEQNMLRDLEGRQMDPLFETELGLDGDLFID